MACWYLRHEPYRSGVRNAKPKETPYKLTDGDGMFLPVQPNGGKYWRLAYPYLGKQKTLALGVYPDVGLALARQRRAEVREQLALGADPGETKKADKRAARVAANNTSEAIALAWFEERRPYVEPRQHDRTRTEITGHGFRAMARTILHEELEQKPEVIEHQLAHAVLDALGSAYNRTKFLKERRVMMQRRADYLDELKARRRTG